MFFSTHPNHNQRNLSFLKIIFPLIIFSFHINCNENNTAPKPVPDFSPSTSPHVQADLAQQLLNLTGGVQVKLVWLQSRLIDEDTMNYVPNYRDFLWNAPSSQLVVFNTDEQKGRLLDSIPSSRGTPLITRDGTKVLWTDFREHALYLINWDGTGKKILLKGNICQIACVQWDNQTQTEWIYVSDMLTIPFINLPTGSIMCRYALKGTDLDTINRELVSQNKFSLPWTVSGDGKYAGSDIDWPYARIESLPQGQLYQVSDTAMFTCHAQIAPDTSYFFFFFPQNHFELAIHKFTAYYGNATVYISGNPITWDCCNPRWTNNVHYLTGGYPYCAGWFLSYVGTPLPSSPKSIPPGTTGEFCLGKFDTNFTAIQWVRLTDLDIRFRKVVGDGWLADGEGPRKR